MNIHETLVSRRAPKIEVAIPDRFESKKLVWRGTGSQMSMRRGESESLHDIFVLARVDTPPLLDIAKPPVVIRSIDHTAAEKVIDYVYYSDDDPDVQVACRYQAPKVIKNINSYLRGEWPISTAYVIGMQRLLAVAELALGKVGDVAQVDGGELDGTTIYTNLAALALEDCGTPPIYPVKTY